MSSTSHRSLKTSLRLLVAAAAAPLLVLLLYSAVDDALRSLREVGSSNSRLVRAVALQLQTFLDDTERLLTTLARRPQLRALDPAQPDPLLEDIPKLHPGFVCLMVLSLRGELLASTVPAGGEFLAVAPTGDWFRRAVREGRPTVSAPVFTPAAGRWVIFLNAPVKDSFGTVAGVMVLVADVARCRLLPLPEELSPGAQLALLSSDGDVIHGTAAFVDWMGQPVRHQPLVEAVLHRKEGQTRVEGPRGLRGLYSFTQVPGSDWYVCAGVEDRVMFAALRENVAIYAVVTMLALAGAAWISYRLAGGILRPVQAVVGVMERAEEDEREAAVEPGGPTEIAALAKRFNEMASARNLAVRVLKASESFGRTVFETLPAGLAVLDGGLRILRVNEAWRRLGAPGGSALSTPSPGMPYLEALSQLAGSRLPDAERLQSALARVAQGLERGLDVEFSWTSPEHGEQWFVLRAARLDDAPRRLLTVQFDITSRRKAELALSALNERLRAVSRRLVEVQEAERRNLALELHDEIGQMLTALKLRLGSAQHAAADPNVVRIQIQTAMELADQLLSQVRQMSVGLRPPLLDELGLGAALQWLVDRRAAEAGFETRFAVPSPLPPLPDIVGSTCFRVVQEALTNVIRHARATQVAIDLRLAPGTLHLSVTDNGQGFDVRAAKARARQGGSLGLIGMEERVLLLGGELECHSAPGQGTRISVTLPIAPDSSPPLQRES